jgi:hypothetical protein
MSVRHTDGMLWCLLIRLEIVIDLLSIREDGVDER